MTIKLHKLSFLSTIFKVTYNAWVTAFDLFIKVKPFRLNWFSWNQKLPNHWTGVYPRFCQLKLNAYDRVASTPELGTNLIDCYHITDMAHSGVSQTGFQWFVISAYFRNEYNSILEMSITCPCPLIWSILAVSYKTSWNIASWYR